MPHAVFTIVTPLRRESLKALDAVLDVIAHDPRTNAYLPFGEFPAVHFASFVTFERETEEPLLVFESSVDGGGKPYFESLLKTAGHGLDAVYRNVDCYPIDRDSAAKLSFFVDRLVTPSLFHVGTPLLTVRNIEADRDLRNALETDLDVLTASPIDRPPAAWLWRRLAELVNVPPSLSTAWMSDVDGGQGPPNVRWIPGREPGRGERLRAWGLAAAIVVALLGSLAVVFGALLLWGVNALIGGYIVLSMLIAVANAILCGWPAGGLRFSWPAVRLMLAAAGIALAAGDLLKIPVINEWISGWPPTAVSIKALFVVLVLLGVGLIGPGLTLWLSTNILPVPSREGDFRPLSREERAEILDAEDRDVQNHMSALVRIEPVWYRLWTLRIFLWLLHRLYYRVVLTKGKLISIPTVHFAQWVLLDRGRFLFLSNYDHSWSRYLDDFGTRIGQGIVKLWGQGIGFPGIGNLSRFKEYARSTMVPHSVWYSAYPGLTVRQIWTNQKLRTDLFTDASDEEAANRLGRLAAADPL
jgi:hypothetical protein